MIQIQAQIENPAAVGAEDARVVAAIAEEARKVPATGGARLTQAAALDAVAMIAKHWVATLSPTIARSVTRGGSHVAVNFGSTRVLCVTVGAEALPDLVDLLMHCYRAGYNTAARLAVGDVFYGARSCAVAQGYIGGTAAHRSFVNGYVDALHKRFPAGIVTKLDDDIILAESGEPQPVAMIPHRS